MLVKSTQDDYGAAFGTVKNSHVIPRDSAVEHAVTGAPSLGVNQIVSL